MSFSTDKDAVINKLKAHNCYDVDQINLAASYDDILPYFLKYANFTQQNPKLVHSIFASIDGTVLAEGQGIYYNQVIAGTVTNPKLIINCTIDEVIINSSQSVFVVFGNNCLVKKLRVTGTSQIGMISLRAGAKVTVLKTEDTARIEAVQVGGSENYLSDLKMIVTGSNIGEVITYGGGTFGEYESLDTTGTCGDEVTTIASEKVTSNSFVVKWDDAAGSINTIVKYRINNTPEWFVPGTREDGVIGSRALDANGFIFRGLQPDTYYDVKVVNVCANGILSSGETLTVKTESV